MGKQLDGFEATLQHALEWQGQGIAGWHWSEKLDGVRARWDGASLYTRSGQPIDAPRELLATLPPQALDIEVYAGRGRYETARQAVQYGRWVDAVRLVVFDMPDIGGDWRGRIAVAQRLGLRVPEHGTCCADPARAVATLRDALRTLHRNDGEGYMLAQPGKRYAQGRTAQLLKFKHESIYEEALAS